MPKTSVRVRGQVWPAPPAAVSLEDLPLALVTHECTGLCRGSFHSLPITVPADTPWSHVDAAAAMAGVRAAIGREARPRERRTVARPGFRIDVIVWAE